MSNMNLRPAAVMIIESGAIYSICVVILLVLYGGGFYEQYILLDIVCSIKYSQRLLLLMILFFG